MHQDKEDSYAACSPCLAAIWAVGTAPPTAGVGEGESWYPRAPATPRWGAGNKQKIFTFTSALSRWIETQDNHSRDTYGSVCKGQGHGLMVLVWTDRGWHGQIAILWSMIWGTVGSYGLQIWSGCQLGLMRGLMVYRFGLGDSWVLWEIWWSTYLVWGTVGSHERSDGLQTWSNGPYVHTWSGSDGGALPLLFPFVEPCVVGLVVPPVPGSNSGLQHGTQG